MVTSCIKAQIMEEYSKGENLATFVEMEYKQLYSNKKGCWKCCKDVKNVATSSEVIRATEEVWLYPAWAACGTGESR